MIGLLFQMHFPSLDKGQGWCLDTFAVLERKCLCLCPVWHPCEHQDTPKTVHGDAVCSGKREQATTA